MSAATAAEPGDRRWGDIEIWQHLRADIDVKAGTEHAPERKHFVKTWYDRLEKAGSLSDHFKNWYYASLFVTSVVAAAVPTLIAFTGSSGSTTSNVLRILAAVLGVLVAAATSLLGIVQVGNRWRVYRSYAQALEEAGWDYLAGSSDDAGYRQFVDDVARARRVYGREYLKEIAVLQRGSGPSDSGGNSGS
jgi:hypothetical protein